MEDLKSMSGADKLKMAPQAESAPEDVVSSFVAGESAKDIAWSGKSLTFWDRVVAYEGTTKSGEKVTLYYDLESGQWAKQYADFDEVSKIPADEAPGVMVVGGQLIRDKEQFDFPWINQPKSVTEDGKIIYRNSELDPIVAWDQVEKKWLTPEQAGVVWTTEVWKQKLSQTIVDRNGISWVPLPALNETSDFITSETELIMLTDANAFLILQPSGVMTVGGGRKYVLERFRQGATIITLKNTNVMTPLDYLKGALRTAYGLYGIGEREVRVEIRPVTEYDIGETQWEYLELDRILTLNLEDGTIVSPVFGLYKGRFEVGKDDTRYWNWIPIEKTGLPINDKNWLDEITKAGYIKYIVN